MALKWVWITSLFVTSGNSWTEISECYHPVLQTDLPYDQVCTKYTLDRGTCSIWGRRGGMWTAKKKRVVRALEIKSLLFILRVGTTAHVYCVSIHSCSAGAMVRVMFLLSPSSLGHSVGKRLWLPSLRGSPFTKLVNTREVFRQQPGHWKPLHRMWVGFGRFSSPFTEDSKITAFPVRRGYLTGGFHHLLYKRKTAMHHRTISLYSVTAEPASVHPRSSQPSATAPGQQQPPKPVLQSEAFPPC